VLQRQRELGLDRKAGTSDLVVLPDGTLRDGGDGGDDGGGGGGRYGGRGDWQSGGGRYGGRGGRGARGGRGGGWADQGRGGRSSYGSGRGSGRGTYGGRGSDARDGPDGGAEDGGGGAGDGERKRSAHAAGMPAPGGAKRPYGGGTAAAAPPPPPMPSRPPRASLLEKLLATEIRRDRSWLLQAARFLAANAFLQDASAPLVYPETAPAAPQPLAALLPPLEAASSSDEGEEPLPLPPSG